MLDQIAGTTQSRKTGKTAEMDELRRMAEAVRAELLEEETVRSVGEVMEVSIDDGYVGAAAARDATPAVAAAMSGANAAPRTTAPAYAATMRAYRENA